MAQRGPEKERLQSNQKRGQLLESLRKSINKADHSTGAREGIQQEFTRAIQAGSPQEIERMIVQYKKQIYTLQSKAMVSSQTNTTIRLFFDRAHVFLEKKKTLVKLEHTINSFCLSKLGEKSNDGSTIIKLTDITKAISCDLLTLTDTLVEQIEDMEVCITKDLYKDEKLHGLFYACLSSVDDKQKGKLISLCQKKTHDASYGNRLYFYKTLVEQLAKTNERVARKVHSHIRKEARALQKSGQYKKATSELCYALHLWKDDMYTYRLLADIFFLMKDKKNAYIALGEVLRLIPEDKRLRKRMAEYYVHIKQFSKAIHEYQILLKDSPTNLSYRRELGRLLYEKKSYDHIPDVLLIYIRTIPEDMECLNIMGNAYIHLHEWEKAIPYLQRSIKLNKSQPDAYHLLSMAFRNLELYEQSIRLLEHGIQFNPDSLSLKILLGNVYLECDMFERVIEILKPVLATHPNSPSLLSTIGKTHFYLNNLDDAILTFTQADKLKPFDLITLVMLAKTYWKKGDSKNTEHFYKTAIQLNQDDISLKQELASFYVETGQWQKATEILKTKIDD